MYIAYVLHSFKTKYDFMEAFFSLKLVKWKNEYQFTFVDDEIFIKHKETKNETAQCSFKDCLR